MSLNSIRRSIYPQKAGPDDKTRRSAEALARKLVREKFEPIQHEMAILEKYGHASLVKYVRFSLRRMRSRLFAEHYDVAIDAKGILVNSEDGWTHIALAPERAGYRLISIALTAMDQPSEDDRLLLCQA